jgi:HNH endonuclease
MEYGTASGGEGDRPGIPANIRRRVLVETGHRCAIPTCRYIEVDADTKAHVYDNLIALCPNCHRRAYKGEIDRKGLRIYKLNLRLAHDKYSQMAGCRSALYPAGLSFSPGGAVRHALPPPAEKLRSR